MNACKQPLEKSFSLSVGSSKRGVTRHAVQPSRCNKLTPTNTMVLLTQRKSENVIICAACLHFHDYWRKHGNSTNILMEKHFNSTNTWNNVSSTSNNGGNLSSKKKCIWKRVGAAVWSCCNVYTVWVCTVLAYFFEGRGGEGGKLPISQ